MEFSLAEVEPVHISINNVHSILCAFYVSGLIDFNSKRFILPILNDLHEPVNRRVRHEWMLRWPVVLSLRTFGIILIIGGINNATGLPVIAIGRLGADIQRVEELVLFLLLLLLFMLIFPVRRWPLEALLLLVII